MAFSLNETTLLSALGSGNIFSVINSTISPSYGIYLADGVGRAIKPKSFLGIDYGNDASVITSPIEGGSYTSFNKIKKPQIIRVIFTIEGWTGFSGSIPNLTNFSFESRTGALSMLDRMIDGTDLYDIETPDTTYQKYDLIRYNYRTSSHDVTLLTIEAIFQAVLETAEVTMSNSTAKESTAGNETSKSGGVKTEQVQASASTSSLDDVKGALSGLSQSISSASVSIATSVSSVADNVTSGAASAINGAATSAITKLSQSTTTLVKGLS